MTKALIFVGILSAIHIIQAARILAIFPTPSISHQVVFRVLTQEIARRGHEIDVITPDPAFSKETAPPNLIEIDVHDISYNYIYELVSKEIKQQKKTFGKENEWAAQIDDSFAFRMTVAEIQLKSEQVRKLIAQRKKYDLLIVEAFIRPVLIFSHFFKAPVIQMSSFGAMFENLQAVGAPTHPFLYPLNFRQRLYNLRVWEKIREYYYHLRLVYSSYKSVSKEDEMLQRIFGSNIPSINDLVNNVDMLFLNVHPIWMDNTPVPPNVIFTGGLHQNPLKELPQDLKSYLDSSKNGVVYVSFGTNVHPIMFPPKRLKALTAALSELPYDVLLVWKHDKLPGKAKNIRISKWLPQSDLLTKTTTVDKTNSRSEAKPKSKRHPNLKAFVTQGGLQSTDEAITAGIPLVCIPLNGDQWYNGEKYVKLKIGLKLNFMTFTKLELKNAIETIISNKSYHENIAKLRSQIKDEPQTPLERAVWWVEYVLRHKGAKHLRAPAANMSIAEYYELQLVSIVITCVSFGLLLFYLGILSLFRCVRNIFDKKDKLKRI